MSRGGRAAVIAVLGLGVVFAAGPRVDVGTEVAAPAPPRTGLHGLERYLAEREDRFTDLIPGTEKRIVWVDSEDPTLTDLAVVYLHGFSASRQEVAPLPQRVAGSLDANLFLTRLRGHGRSPGAMAEGSVAGWIEDGVEALEVATRMGRRVVLMGTSTGGTLALWLAAQEQWRDRIEAVVLISPNLGPRDRTSEVLLWPWGGFIARAVTGPERAFTPRNQAQARYWTEQYPVRALLPMMGLVKLARDLDPARITAPTFVAYSPLDRVVDVSRVEELVPRLGASRTKLVVVEGAEGGDYHVLAGTILAPENTVPLTRAIVGFVEGS